MTYAIIGTGIVGATLAPFFAAKDIPVLIANSRGPETFGKVTAELGASVKAITVDEAVKADIILVAVGAVAFKDVGALLQDWSGKIVIDVTNGFMLPPEVQQAEYQGRLTSEVNAERVPGAKLVKAFNQLPIKVLASPLPDDVGRRVVFVSSDHKDASATVAALAESLGFAAIEVGKIAEGGRLIQARAALGISEFDQIPAVESPGRRPLTERAPSITAAKPIRESKEIFLYRTYCSSNVPTIATTTRRRPFRRFYHVVLPDHRARLSRGNSRPPRAPVHPGRRWR